MYISYNMVNTASVFNTPLCVYCQSWMENLKSYLKKTNDCSKNDWKWMTFEKTLLKLGSVYLESYP